jgi:hypothetical protein
MNELKTQIKKQKQNMKNNETTPKYVETRLQAMKTTERKRISKVDAKQTRLRRVKSESGT